MVDANKNAPLSLSEETKAQLPLRYHSCSDLVVGTRLCVIGHKSAQSTDPLRAFGAQLGGDNSVGCFTALHQPAALYKTGGTNRVLFVAIVFSLSP